MEGTREIFVVAGSHREYVNLVNIAQQTWDFELNRKMVHYVNEPFDLEGIHGARVFLYGTYFKRRDYDLIEQVIRRNSHRPLLIR